MTRRFVSHRRAETEASDADIALLERSASLSHIDCCASEHGIDRLREAAFASKLPEVRGRPVDHPVLQVVEVKTGCVDAQALAPPGSLAKSCRRCRLRTFRDAPPVPSTPADQSAAEAEPPVL
jgi:hypothetical protein